MDTFKVTSTEFINFLTSYFNGWEGFKNQRLGQAFYNTFGPHYLAGNVLDNTLFYEEDNAKAINIITTHYVRYDEGRDPYDDHLAANSHYWR